VLGLCFFGARARLLPRGQACCFFNSIIRVTGSTILSCRARCAKSDGALLRPKYSFSFPLLYFH